MARQKIGVKLIWPKKRKIDKIGIFSNSKCGHDSNDKWNLFVHTKNKCTARGLLSDSDSARSPSDARPRGRVYNPNRIDSDRDSLTVELETTF